LVAIVITLDDLDRFTAGRLGVVDAPCPSCGPHRRSPVNQRRKVLRVWRLSPTFVTYRCARCDLHGYVCEDGAPAPDTAAKARAEAQHLAAETAQTKRRKAQWLWGCRRPIAGTPAERYLREVRRYGGPIPPTIGFLPARGDFPPAMISVFGMPTEIEPGVIAISTDAVQGVHLTRLRPDGFGKAGTEADKIMLGQPRGSPIALAAINDSLALAIVEGIEDGLSITEATGLATWAAGAASLMPPLAPSVPSFLDALTIIADPDEVGRRFASELAGAVRARHVHCRLIVWGSRDLAA